MLVLRTLERVMDGFPTEWEGQTNDGRSVFIRYRGGRLRVYASPPGGTQCQAICADPLLETYVGGALDGFMTDGELIEETGIKLLIMSA